MLAHHCQNCLVSAAAPRCAAALLAPLIPFLLPFLPPGRTMEFTERKRSRKSQSFKLINQDYHHEIYKISDYSNDVNGETKETQPVFLGDESREIKKQITGMRRLLNDSTGRIYQRVGKEGEKLKEEPQDLDLAWAQRLNPPAESQASLHPSQSGAWNELSPQASHFSGQYGTRSKTFQNQTRAVTSNGEIPMVNSSIGPNCCTCNCQSTLQAILQELKTMRKLMQIQAVGTQNRQQPPVPLICAQKSTISRKRNKKKKLPLKTVEPITMNKKTSTAENEKKLSANSERSNLQAVEPPLSSETPVSGFGIILESTSSDKCNLQKALMSSCRNLSWTLYYQTILAQEVCSLGSWSVHFLMTRLWLTLYQMAKGKEGSMTTEKD
ncbi:BEN domain-containing protein 7 isoform X7 [Cygnus olor]|uniref:BEN domain-containing protein 7 isoform X7 n=1 Tax=Cygnus olor TaxID=8869 RepID=UPI001ADE9791|nr:BEN domain-containing protein 7 isoform X7 [Cygnus olor]